MVFARDASRLKKLGGFGTVAARFVLRTNTSGRGKPSPCAPPPRNEAAGLCATGALARAIGVAGADARVAATAARAASSSATVASVEAFEAFRDAASSAETFVATADLA
jgi:hypothetical protein